MPSKRPRTPEAEGPKGGLWAGGRLVAFALIALALLRGLIYASAIPPLDSPDENSHYEYARLLYEKRGLPTAADTSPALRQEVEAFMAGRRLGLWRPGPDGTPRLAFNSELERQPPGYYLLAAAPYALTVRGGLGLQVYAMRLLSVILGALVVLLAYLTAREAFPGDLFLNLGIPGLVLFIPGYTFIASSVNNDGLAVLSVSLLVYLLVRIMRRGISPSAALGVGVALALAIISKRTAAAAVPLALVALSIYFAERLVRGLARPRRLALALVGLGVTVAVLFPLVVAETDDAEGWTKRRLAAPSVADGPARIGRYALQVQDESQEDWQFLTQTLPPDRVAALRGQRVTLGAWMRAPQGKEVYGGLALGEVVGSAKFEQGQAPSLTDEWTFHRVTMTLNPQADQVYVQLYVGTAASTGSAYYDGVVLAEGAREGEPVYADASAGRGSWGGRPFVNWLENGSGERRILGMRPLAVLALEALHVKPGLLATVLDPARYGPEARAGYPFLLRFAFESFWARFGWLSLALDAAWYDAVLGMGLLAAVGLLLLLGKLVAGRDGLALGSQKCLWVFALGALLVLGTGLLPFLAQAYPGEWPQGRYLYPGLVPIAALFVLGLRQYLPRRWLRPGLIGFLAALFLYDALAWTNYILPHYYGS